MREKFNILSITSLYNQWPLQDLIFKIFNKKDIIFYTSMHGGAHSMYKLYPCMDQNWNHSYKNIFLINDKNNKLFISQQIKSFKFELKKRLNMS